MIEPLKMRDLKENGWGMDSHLSGAEIAHMELVKKINELIRTVNQILKNLER